MLQGVDLPVQIDIDADMQDATKHSLILMGPSIILPDTTYYTQDNPAGKQLLSIYSDMAKKILEFTPLSEEEQKTYLEDTLSFDGLVAKKVKSQLEWAEYYKCHNPMPAAEVGAVLDALKRTGIGADKAKPMIGMIAPALQSASSPHIVTMCRVRAKSPSP